MGESFPSSLDIEALREIDRACDRFEAAWRSGSRPSLPDHLGSTGGAGRAALARELVLVDVAWRRRSGDEPRADDYSSVAELDAAWLREALATDEGPRAARFVLLDRIGTGAFGAVWKARDTRLDRVVALKILHGAHDASRDALDRFHREARAAARLSHPGIAAVHETAVVDGRPALVTEYVEGRSLRAILAERRLGAREAAAIAAHVADALEYAHEMGVVHRDLKPANVVLDEARHRPVVVDFGLAALEGSDATLTHDGEVLGTPAYMSPEQAAGRRDAVSRASDVYGLGAILFEMACGTPPFTGPAAEVIARVKQGAAPRPRTLAPDVPRDLDTIIAKAMAPEPASRYASARLLAEDLRRFLDGEPIRARRETALEAVRRFARRHRLAVATAAGIVALIVIASVVVGLAAARARREAATSASVARLLEGLFEAAGPEESLGQDVSARELLTRGVARIEGDASLDPLVRARLMRILGGVLLDLGDVETAHRLQQSALDLRRERLDPDDPVVADSEFAMASVLLKRGDAEGAGKLAASALASRERALPEGDPARVASLHQMGEVGNARKDPAAARAYFERSIAAIEAAHGPDDPLLLHDLSALSTLIAQQGDYRTALPMAERALAIARRAYEPEHPELAKTYALVAQAYRYTGRWDEALDATEKSVAMLERIYGEENSWVRAGYLTRAELLEHAGRQEDAERDYLKAVAMAEKADGADSLQAATAVNRLAMFYVNVGRLAEVEPLYRRVLEIRQAKLPAGDSALVSATANLARQLARTGRAAEAEQMLRGLLERIEQSGGEDSTPFAQVSRYLCGVLIDQGRAEEAMPVVRRIAAAWQAAPPRPSPPTGDAARQFGDAALRSGHHAEAIPFYERAIAIFRATEGPKDARLAIALHEMAVCLRFVGCDEAAERAFRESLAIHDQLTGVDGPNSLSCAGNLAGLLAAAGRMGDAEAALERVAAAQAKGYAPLPSALGAMARIASAEGRGGEAVTIARTAVERASPATPQEAGALLCLGEILLAQGAASEAERALARAVEIRTATGGPGSPALAPYLASHAAALEALGRHDDAAALAPQLDAVRAATPPCPDSSE